MTYHQVNYPLLGGALTPGVLSEAIPSIVTQLQAAGDVDWSTFRTEVTEQMIRAAAEVTPVQRPRGLTKPPPVKDKGAKR